MMFETEVGSVCVLGWAARGVVIWREVRFGSCLTGATEKCNWERV